MDQFRTTVEPRGPTQNNRLIHRLTDVNCEYVNCMHLIFQAHDSSCFTYIKRKMIQFPFISRGMQK